LPLAGPLTLASGPRQPPLEVVEVALDVAQLGELLECILSSDGVPRAPGLGMAIDRRTYSFS
jgi:hypothetical protein